MIDGWRLAVGTLTALRIRSPDAVDRGTARVAMLLAPLAVLPLAALVAGVVGLGGLTPLPHLAVATIAIGMLALGSRALHWDGLSDVADGLTASYDRERSLAVMRTGTSGPAGTIALVVLMVLQVSSLAAYVGTWAGALAAGCLVSLSRCALWIVCCTRVPPARPDGLGRLYTGTVPMAVAALGVLLLSVGGGVAVWLLVRRATTRFGGVTGDVMGAAVEVALAATLLTWSWL